MVKYTQTIRLQQPTNCLSVFEYFVKLVLKGLNPLNIRNQTWRRSLSVDQQVLESIEKRATLVQNGLHHRNSIILTHFMSLISFYNR